jgi:hypothetical protein
MRLIQFMSLADDQGCRIQVDDGGEISLVAQQGPPGPVSDLTMVALPLTPRDAHHLTMWLNMAISAAQETTAGNEGAGGAPGT